MTYFLDQVLATNALFDQQRTPIQRLSWLLYKRWKRGQNKITRITSGPVTLNNESVYGMVFDMTVDDLVRAAQKNQSNLQHGPVNGQVWEY